MFRDFQCSDLSDGGEGSLAGPTGSVSFSLSFLNKRFVHNSSCSRDGGSPLPALLPGLSATSPPPPSPDPHHRNPHASPLLLWSIPLRWYPHHQLCVNICQQLLMSGLMFVCKSWSRETYLAEHSSKCRQPFIVSIHFMSS